MKVIKLTAEEKAKFQELKNALEVAMKSADHFDRVANTVRAETKACIQKLGEKYNGDASFYPVSDDCEFIVLHPKFEVMSQSDKQEQVLQVQ